MVWARRKAEARSHELGDSGEADRSGSCCDGGRHREDRILCHQHRIGDTTAVAEERYASGRGVRGQAQHARAANPISLSLSLSLSIRRPLAERLEQVASTKQQKTQQQKTAQSFCNNLAQGRGLPLPFPLPGAPKIAPPGWILAFFCSPGALPSTPWKNNQKTSPK